MGLSWFWCTLATFGGLMADMIVNDSVTQEGSLKSITNKAVYNVTEKIK